MQSALHATTLLLVLALLGCAGHTTIDVSTGGAGAAQTSASALDAAQTAAANDNWRQWLADPGQAGVDFDPRRIAVIFNAAATIPPTMDALRLPAGQRAADQPNGLLRETASAFASRSTGARPTSPASACPRASTALRCWHS